MTNWPVNYAEQRLLYEHFTERLNTIRKANKQVVLYKLTQPNRAQWETAFVRQTGLSLPIPPGVRLMWYNPLSGLVKTYSTAYDENGGEGSSGEIYPMVDPRYQRGALRLIGSIRAGAGQGSVLEQSYYNGYPSANGELHLVIPIDMILETKRGLLSLLVVGKGHGELYLEGRPYSLDDFLWVDATKQAAGATEYFRQTGSSTGSASSAAATSGGNYLFTAQSYDGSIIVAPHRYAALFASISTPALRMISDQVQQVGPGVTAVALSASFAISSHTRTITMIGARRATPLPILNGIDFNVSTGAMTGYPDFKCFVYGLYADNEVQAGVHE